MSAWSSLTEEGIVVKWVSAPWRASWTSNAMGWAINILVDRDKALSLIEAIRMGLIRVSGRGRLGACDLRI